MKGKEKNAHTASPVEGRENKKERHREERSNGRIICRKNERGMRENLAPHRQKTAGICDHKKSQSEGMLPKYIQEIERFCYQ